MNNKSKHSAMRYIIVSVLVLLLVVLLWVVIYRNQNKPVEVSYDKMISQIENNEVTGIYVNGGYTVYYTTDSDLSKFNKNPSTYA